MSAEGIIGNPTTGSKEKGAGTSKKDVGNAIDDVRVNGQPRYLSKLHPVLKRNCEVFSACDWLAAFTAHIPNAGEHLVRYYGWYSTVSRGKRRKAQGEATTAIVDSSEISPSEATRAWARLITQVYEVDPLGCPQYAGAMRIIACIEQPAVIEKILTHLGLWPTHIHSPTAGVPVAIFPATGLIAGRFTPESCPKWMR